ncbi:HTH-type transcriptional regulator RutR [Caulobacter segnis]|uniref:HTH-type transcriptional regulator RutR n=1 Tax=Caulobacter segnis TaxID=88688 RepID=UPI0028660BCD|nr:HTH-type transcriptional regulator RutR [Caulobacter segnis]MDR6625599.1 TetR/AcrR family transcriptional regulator [Caulobacter segnis]
MAGPSAKSVKPPRRAAPRASGQSRSGARALVKAAQSAGETAAPVSPPAGRRAQAGEARKGAILGAALSVFARLGLDGASIDAIARAAGLSKANLLYYYPSKDALYVAVLEQGLSRWLAPLARFRREEDPAEAIGALIEAKLAMSRDHPEVSRLFALEMLRGAPLLKPVLAGPLKAVFDAKVAVVQAWVAAGRLAPVEPPHLIFSIWALTQHYADFAVQVRALSGRSLSDKGFMEEAVAAVTALVLDGVRPR